MGARVADGLARAKAPVEMEQKAGIRPVRGPDRPVRSQRLVRPRPRPPLNFFDELFGIFQSCPGGLAILFDRLDLVTMTEGFHHRCRQIRVWVVLETRISE